MSLQNLHVILRHKSEKELIDEIAELYKRFDAVKRYDKVPLLNDDEEDVFNYNVRKIKQSMLPTFTIDTPLPVYEIADAKKIILEYKMMSSNGYGIARLMLFYIELCIHIINEYDYIETVWTSGISTFETLMTFIKKNDLDVGMHKEIERVVQLSSQHIEMNCALACIYEMINIKD
ncbi:hypothetical protein C9J12_29155 [Photobacterium frigidiphilum]|uniref:Uncharacterized protein n=1 Tax=Photobacterium frigidiphilum TaxID=264736 RepID=A0A2T3J5Y6_9GAMM|nr:DUF6155 family protein [Photobacterium frigidiphilum]PSU42143.1 hypothetical protein C9J12_29155 [Photobacterium frigidiphilum]